MNILDECIHLCSILSRLSHNESDSNHLFLIVFLYDWLKSSHNYVVRRWMKTMIIGNHLCVIIVLLYGIAENSKFKKFDYVFKTLNTH